MVDSRFFEIKGPFPVEEVCRIASCRLRPEDKAASAHKVKGVAALNNAGPDEISFLDNPKYVDVFKASKAGVCIINEKHARHAPEGMILLLAENPYLSFAMITEAFYPSLSYRPVVSKNANIDKTAKIGKDCCIEAGAFIGAGAVVGDNNYIGPNTVIGRGVCIGNNCYISGNTTLTYCLVGNNCIIHSGVRIGQDGFGFATNDKGVHIKVPQVGRVIIGNNVEIGANTCIDRGSSTDTMIGDGTKIDNLVQIGHNVQTGKGCIIVSQVGISGSTKLGDYVVLAGQVGLAGHLKIGAGARVAAQSGVMHDIPPGQNYGGYPAIPIKQWHRQNVTIKNITNKAQND